MEIMERVYCFFGKGIFWERRAQLGIDSQCFDGFVSLWSIVLRKMIDRPAFFETN